ncbi:FCD domain-containing protein [Pusillimonas sp. TS35]|uniref:GntR family transcriptional regulator n=1 Tax=Paracandidimonas lactea TaxID=2895524 RepID=UPI00136FBDDF|nr:GntR family transcriptional regulator [Paracandidimonas lactea]MYN13890.1 FCD domain-containing protein [Pusillimonas sp. TS35]
MKISETIRRSIEDDIRSGNLLPGDVIDETLIAKKLKVSRTPVREALLQLEAQGMLVSQPRQGMVVAKMDVQQLLAMWELLAELEGICVRLACERMSNEEVADLVRVHQESEKIASEADADDWHVANEAFHEILYSGCRNPYLRQEILQLRARTGAYLRRAFGSLGRTRQSFEQHGDIVNAIQNRDSQRAYEMMMHHISLAHGARGLTNFLINLPRSMLKE